MSTTYDLPDTFDDGVALKAARRLLYLIDQPTLDMEEVGKVRSVLPACVNCNEQYEALDGSGTCGTCNDQSADT